MPDTHADPVGLLAEEPSEFERQLLGYRLTTAEVLYHLPEQPGILQTFVWQTLDLAPDFPRIRKFLDFWEREIDGRLHSVRVASADLVAPAELRPTDAEFRLH